MLSRMMFYPCNLIGLKSYFAFNNIFWYQIHVSAAENVKQEGIDSIGTNKSIYATWCMVFSNDYTRNMQYMPDIIAPYIIYIIAIQ